ncbi:MAG: 2-oxo acid dehydrogenase subunit E2 [Candidatus Alcyoniella australis]|nr:2-oxo acid dehydrogenase subunit E2 [Candidatus Alcyoniella australis]
MVKRPLRLRKLSVDEIGIARQNQIVMFSTSPDPYVTIVVNVDAGPLRNLVNARRESSGRPITMVHAFNKLLAMCFVEHPEYNCVVLDRKMYELETITISNPFLLPGDERALTMLLMDDPQTKSLEQIFDEMELLKQLKRAEYDELGQMRVGLVPKLYLRSGLYRVISEKRQFKIVYERNLTTNLVLSKANNVDTNNFLATKGAMQILRTFSRFFLHSIMDQPQVVDGNLTVGQVIPLSMMLDHRLVDGAHVNAFVRSINRIAAEPEKYL